MNYRYQLIRLIFCILHGVCLIGNIMVLVDMDRANNQTRELANIALAGVHLGMLACWAGKGCVEKGCVEKGCKGEN